MQKLEVISDITWRLLRWHVWHFSCTKPKAYALIYTVRRVRDSGRMLIGEETRALGTDNPERGAQGD